MNTTSGWYSMIFACTPETVVAEAMSTEVMNERIDSRDFRASYGSSGGLSTDSVAVHDSVRLILVVERHQSVVLLLVAHLETDEQRDLGLGVDVHRHRQQGGRLERLGQTDQHDELLGLQTPGDVVDAVEPGGDTPEVAGVEACAPPAGRQAISPVLG